MFEKDPDKRNKDPNKKDKSREHVPEILPGTAPEIEPIPSPDIIPPEFENLAILDDSGFIDPKTGEIVPPLESVEEAKKWSEEHET